MGGLCCSWCQKTQEDPEQILHDSLLALTHKLPRFAYCEYLAVFHTEDTSYLRRQQLTLRKIIGVSRDALDHVRQSKALERASTTWTNGNIGNSTRLLLVSVTRLVRILALQKEEDSGVHSIHIRGSKEAIYSCFELDPAHVLVSYVVVPDDVNNYYNTSSIHHGHNGEENGDGEGMANDQDDNDPFMEEDRVFDTFDYHSELDSIFSKEILDDLSNKVRIYERRPALIDNDITHHPLIDHSNQASHNLIDQVTGSPGPPHHLHHQ